MYNTILTSISNVLGISTNATIHFSGIGGYGMSALARIMHSLGFHVQGSDIAMSNTLSALQESGIRIFHTHSAENVINTDIVVYSSAINAQNPELIQASDKGIKLLSRGALLAAITNDQHSICVAGAHGKTTTTAMIASMMCAGNMQPTIINGGIMCEYGTNAVLSTQKDMTWCVVETDESDGSFLLLQPTIAVITNIDEEHISYYKNFTNLKKAFEQFICNVEPDGIVILNYQDQVLREILLSMCKNMNLQTARIKFVTYELCDDQNVKDEESVRRTMLETGACMHIVGSNIKYNGGNFTYDVCIHSSIHEHRIIDIPSGVLKNVKLQATGIHNAQNSLAAIACTMCCGCNVSVEGALKGLAKFAGVKRRFTNVGVLGQAGARVVDDYAHHPHEVCKVISAAKLLLQSENKGGRVIAVIQPHRYTRLAALMDEFVHSLLSANVIIVLDVYAASEEEIQYVNSKILYEKILQHNHSNTHYLPTTDAQQIKDKLHKCTAQNDIILCMGAGDITQIAAKLCE